MKYHFMYEHRTSFSVARMAHTLQVSESGYYKWKNRFERGVSRKEKKDQELMERIIEIYRASRCSFGVRQVTKTLNQGTHPVVNHKRVERLMRKHGLFSKIKRKRILTTNSNHTMSVADNLLARNFTALDKHEKMVSDTTVVKSKQGYLYVAGIMDLYGRMIVGLAMSQRNDRYLVLEALEDMISRGCGKEGCIVHSDRGAPYCSKEYRQRLEQEGFLCSMSRKGNCWDNAPMESFWSKLKNEWLEENYNTLEEAKRDIYEYVWSFYPEKRPHSSNGNLTPFQYYYQV